MEELESKNTWVFNTDDDGPKWPKIKSETIYRLIQYNQTISFNYVDVN